MINIFDFGARPDGSDSTPAVRAALAECRKIKANKLVFPKGRYSFRPEYAAEKLLFVSNHGEGLRRIAFPLEHVENLEIDGQGSDFVFEDYLCPFLLDHAKNITLANFTIDYTRTFHSEGRILSVHDEGMDLEIPEQYPYKVDNGILVFTGHPGPSGPQSSAKPGDLLYPYFGVLEFDPAKRETAFMARDYWVGLLSAESLGGRKVRILQPDLKGTPGNILVFSPDHRAAPGVVVSDSCDTRLRDVTFYHCGGMGVIGQRSHNISLERVAVTPRADSVRTISITADATHFVNCTGRIEMGYCLFDRQKDDASNIHGTYVKIVQMASDRKFTVQLVHPQQYGFDFITAGTELEFVESASLVTVGTGKVVSAERLNKEFTEVVLAEPVPEGVKPGHVVAEICEYPEIHIHHCRMRGNRARGLLLNCRGKTLIEDNYFHHAGAAILFEGDARFWFEQAGVQDCVVRNNLFDNCVYGVWGSATIEVAAGIAEDQRPGSRYNRNLVIEGNIFREFDSHSQVKAYCVDGLTIRNNRIEYAEHYPSRELGREPFDIEHCDRVDVGQNTFVAIEELLDSDSDNVIALGGEWQLALREGESLPDDAGLDGLVFNDFLPLPGSLSEHQKGTPNADRNNRDRLSLEFLFEGTAFYRRTIEIPEDWRDRRIVLRMERTRKTAVWLDGQLLGTNPHLCVPQVYELGSELAPGTHVLTVAVDNVIAGSLSGMSHMNSEDTQTNWNGILGRLQLESTPRVFIEHVRVFPNIHERKAVIKLMLRSEPGRSAKGEITIETESVNGAEKHRPDPVTVPFGFSAEATEVEAVVALGEGMQLWDEFSPAFYQARITLRAGSADQVLARTFGMVEFKADGTQFTVNGKRVFLRGTHDGCVFPLTGYAPMNVSEWVRVLRIAQSYGINHYRFHTWCPPEAAFTAADIVGIYMQPELPCWGVLAQAEKNIVVKDINAAAFGAETAAPSQDYDPSTPTGSERYFHEEARRILHHFGDHPSFRMFAIGNELWGNREVMARLVEGFRSHDDNRRLYAEGSNNYFWDPAPGPGDDFFTTVRTSTQTLDNLDNTTRASFSMADQFGGGPINSRHPSTRVNFSKALAGMDLPVIGHETGQYQYYPDYTEIDKYTGVLKPWNLTIARDILKEKGMLNQAPDFFRAAGRWASLLYCEDMESSVRTPGFGGFQILDLKDYPGQGTALIGPLNAFMESKGTITPEKWREFCAPVTLLAEFDAYTLAAGDSFQADLKIANFGAADLIGKTLRWSIEGIEEGAVTVVAPKGGITALGTITLAVPEVRRAERRDLVMTIPGTGLIKSYPLWIYPAPAPIVVPDNVTIATNLDSRTVEELERGQRVLLIPDHASIKDNSVGGLFMTDYWSYPMFKSICESTGREPSPGTMGLLIDERHPALSRFPTEFHSNWQWWAAVMHSRPIILDETPAGYRPFVQTIDNMWRNHKLGTLFEFKVGKGRLLISAIDLPAIEETPEGHALFTSILDYMSSDAFDPQDELDVEGDVARKFSWAL